MLKSARRPPRRPMEWEGILRANLKEHGQVRPYPIIVAVRSIAIGTMLLVTDMAAAQQGSPMQWAPPPQHSFVPRRQPIANGRHLQPRESDLQESGVPAPSRQEIEEIDRLTRQLLQESQPGRGGERH